MKLSFPPYDHPLPCLRTWYLVLQLLLHDFILLCFILEMLCLITFLNAFMCHRVLLFEYITRIMGITPVLSIF